MNCKFCGVRLDPNSKHVWHTMKGWERPGQAGGSDIALRERTHEAVACDTCIRMQQGGVNPRQEALT